MDGEDYCDNSFMDSSRRETNEESYQRGLKEGERRERRALLRDAKKVALPAGYTNTLVLSLAWIKDWIRSRAKRKRESDGTKRGLKCLPLWHLQFGEPTDAPLARSKKART